MNSYFLEERIIFLQFQTFRGVFLVLCRDITRHTRHTTGFLLGAFQYDLYSCVFIFLCHFLYVFEVAKVLLFFIPTNFFVKKKYTFTIKDYISIN